MTTSYPTAGPRFFAYGIIEQSQGERVADHPQLDRVADGSSKLGERAIRGAQDADDDGVSR